MALKRRRRKKGLDIVLGFAGSIGFNELIYALGDAKVIYYAPRRRCVGRVCREDIIVDKDGVQYYVTLWVPKNAKRINVSRVNVWVDPLKGDEAIMYAVSDKLRRMSKRITLRRFLNKRLGI